MYFDVEDDIMKLSVINPRFLPEREQFAYIKECGFDACDFSLGEYFGKKGMFPDVSSLTDVQIKEHFTGLRALVDSVGLEIGQTHAEFTGHPSAYDYDMEDIIKRQIASIKATYYLGARYCIIHPVIKPGRRYDLLVKEAFDESVEFYRRLIPTLEEYDIYCCIENMWVTDPVYKNICSTILSHAEEMVSMCETLGDRFKICVDIGHGILTQDDPAEMIRICGDKLACLHTHDNDGISDIHSTPFALYSKPYSVGWSPMRIDWIDVMKALDDVNYRGNLNFEVDFGGPDEIKAAAHRYLAAVGEYLISLRTVKY